MTVKALGLWLLGPAAPGAVSVCLTGRAGLRCSGGGGLGHLGAAEEDRALLPGGGAASPRGRRVQLAPRTSAAPRGSVPGPFAGLTRGPDTGGGLSAGLLGGFGSRTLVVGIFHGIVFILFHVQLLISGLVAMEPTALATHVNYRMRRWITSVEMFQNKTAVDLFPGDP